MAIKNIQAHNNRQVWNVEFMQAFPLRKPIEMYSHYQGFYNYWILLSLLKVVPSKDASLAVFRQLPYLSNEDLPTSSEIVGNLRRAPTWRCASN